MNDKLKNIFADIYHSNKWGGKESRSGPGSDKSIGFKLNQEIYRVRELFNIHSILDIPCGDFNWFTPPVEDEYIGADIVPDIIGHNKVNHPDYKFVQLDITTDELPTVDLVFVRDLFGHLSHENVFKALNNIKRSGSRYLLTTSFTGRITNYIKMGFGKEISVFDGNWIPINMCIEPFNLVPIYLINEHCVEGNGGYRDKCLMLFDVNDIPNYTI